MKPVVAYFEAYVPNQYYIELTFAKLEVDDAFITKLVILQGVCKTYHLSEARKSFGPEWFPEKDADELRLVTDELVVANNAFWFRADIKHTDLHVETRSFDIDSFVRLLGTGQTRFGDYSDEEWDEYIKQETA